MKNIHILPTDKPPIKGDLLLRHIWEGKPNECISWWRYNDTSTYGSVVVYTTLNGSFMDSPSSFKVQNLYITNDEEIKVGDYFIESLGLPDSYLVHKLSKEWKDKESFYRRCTKVILTTDQDLIKDGIQSIDDEFLQWFVKNPSCEEVKVEEIDSKLPKKEVDGYFSNETLLGYKIIIPKQEPKQETFEEAAEKFATDCTLISDSAAFKGFTEGAAWQAERSYSEEEVLNIQEKYNEYIQKNFNPEFSILPFKVFFEQFKKK